MFHTPAQKQTDPTKAPAQRVNKSFNTMRAEVVAAERINPTRRSVYRADAAAYR